MNNEKFYEIDEQRLKEVDCACHNMTFQESKLFLGNEGLTDKDHYLEVIQLEGDFIFLNIIKRFMDVEKFTIEDLVLKVGLLFDIHDKISGDTDPFDATKDAQKSSDRCVKYRIFKEVI